MALKEICLIEPVPDCLKAVKSYLSDINARYSVVQNTGDITKSGVNPDLLVVFASREHSGITANIPDFPAVPSILICDRGFRFDETSHYQPSFILQVPITKQSFLSKAALCLGIPPRRFFSIVVTITEEGRNIRYAGISKDFSETGMSLEAFADFPLNQAVSVRFVDARNRKKFCLTAEVARKSDVDKGVFFYGLKFTDLTSQDADSLKLFISASDGSQPFSPGR